MATPDRTANTPRHNTAPSFYGTPPQRVLIPAATPSHTATTATAATKMPAATPLPTPPLTAGFASAFALPAATADTSPYRGFVSGHGDGHDLDDIFGGPLQAPHSMGMSFDMNMDVGMDMDLGHFSADTLPLFQPSTPLQPFAPASAYPAPPASTGRRVASLGMSRLHLDSEHYESSTHNNNDDDDLFGGQDIFYSGDAAMSSPAASASASASASHCNYPDPVSYASMPPVSAASAPPPPLPLPLPFTLPMPSYKESASDSPMDMDHMDHMDHMGSPMGSPVRRRGLRHEKSMPNLGSRRVDRDRVDKDRLDRDRIDKDRIDPGDWRARLRYCEQAPNKALLEASMVRLLEFTDSMDERELAERRAANLRFDKIREQRLKDRNNEAAKRSRQRKVARIEAAEQQIASLRRERAQLVSEVASLRRRLASEDRDTKEARETGGRRVRPLRSMPTLAGRVGSRADDAEEEITVRDD